MKKLFFIFLGVLAAGDAFAGSCQLQDCYGGSPGGWGDTGSLLPNGDIGMVWNANKSVQGKCYFCGSGEKASPSDCDTGDTVTIDNTKMFTCTVNSSGKGGKWEKKDTASVPVDTDAAERAGLAAQTEADRQRAAELARQAQEAQAALGQLAVQPAAVLTEPTLAQTPQTGDLTRVRELIASIRVLDKADGWKRADGTFNWLRLGADAAGGAILGAGAGLLTNNLIKKSQLEKGYESIQCTFNSGAAAYGETFMVR